MNVILCNIMSYCIYKICCEYIPEYIYVGSTKAFRQRKSQHKSACINGNTQKLYTTIKENGGWDNWRMVMIEDCGEISLTEARIKEEECRMKLKANLNMVRCYSSEEEIKEHIKQYNEANKEQKKEYDKQYRETNKEKIKEYHKQYNEVNKEKINKHKNQKFTCECGKTITLGEKSKHLKRNIHKKLMEEINK
jgi:hypothetical protein